MLNDTGIICQSRMGSERLPGKTLRKFGKTTLLGYILERIKKHNLVKHFVVATTAEDEDAAIMKTCEAVGVRSFRGSSHNVLQRFVNCANFFNFNRIIRMTGDNPFFDVNSMEVLEFELLSGSYDYSETISSLPKGIGLEIFSLKCLELSLAHAESKAELEHVNEYVLANQHRFRCKKLELNFPEVPESFAFSIDTLEDYKKAVNVERLLRRHSMDPENLSELCLEYC